MNSQNRKQQLDLIGIARRAFKVTSGTDQVLHAIRHGKAKLVFLAHDAASNTQKQVRDKTKFYNIMLDESFSSVELSMAVGQNNRKAIAIVDTDFANALKQKLNQ